jgi:hypothetical protein
MLAMGVVPGLWLPAIENGVHLPQTAEQLKGSVVVPQPLLQQTAVPAATDEEGPQ